MTSAFPSRRGSIQQPQQLPYHRSKFYKANRKQYYSLQRKSEQQKRRRRWLGVILLILCFVGYRYYGYTTAGKSFTGAELIDRDFPELAIAQQYQPTPSTAERIPKIIHFVYGLKAPNPQLDLIHYLAIQSAHDRLQPDEIMFHYHYLPTGDLFEQIKPLLSLHKVDLVPTVFDAPVTHFAHQADIIRLDMLLQYGGIYLDLDVISLAPMDHLLHHQFVMGQEGIDGSVGLCNAVILARPQSRFLQRWRQTYRTFDQTKWNYHSVVLPGKLAATGDFDDEMTVLNHTSFFWPLWDSQGLRTLFLEKSYDFAMNYATHVWESAANPHLMAGLSKEVLLNVDNSLYCQVRFFLKDVTNVKACKLLAHSERPDQLVGHWSLALPQDETLLNINPTPAVDISGNDMHGIIRNGYFNQQRPMSDDGVYVSGKDAYVFLSMPTAMHLPLNGLTDGDDDQGLTVSWQMKTADDKEGGTAVMIQTDLCKLFIKTQRISQDTISLGVETWMVEEDGWKWAAQPHLSVPAGVMAINHDNQYHDFALVLRQTNEASSGSLLVPDLVLYMDGNVLASHTAWRLPAAFNTGLTVRGLWFGSAEPEKYQDEWDTRPSLAAWYKQIQVWERPLTVDAIREIISQRQDNKNAEKENSDKDSDLHVTVPSSVFKNADDQAKLLQKQVKDANDDNSKYSNKNTVVTVDNEEGEGDDEVDYDDEIEEAEDEDVVV